MKRKTMFKTGDILELTMKCATDDTRFLTYRALIVRTFKVKNEEGLSISYSVLGEPNDWEDIIELRHGTWLSRIEETVLEENGKKIGHIDLSKWIKGTVAEKEKK